MKTFLAVLSEKQPPLFNDQLLKMHVDFLKQLKAKAHLIICGPFSDNKGAVLLIKADSLTQAEEIVKQDPFVSQNYYKRFTIHEFTSAGEENNWLMEDQQTKDNLQK